MAKSKKATLGIIKSVSAFSKKMERFMAANPEGKPSHTLSADEIRQKKIDYHEQDYRASVAEAYKKYKFPYKTLGETPEADAINGEEQHLLAAYNLFKAVQEANRQFSVQGTYIRDNVVSCALCDMEQYTLGDNFIYLQCWLYFEQKAKDFFPFMSVNPDASYTLKFAPLKDYRFNYKDKEVFAIIKQCYYPTED